MEFKYTNTWEEFEEYCEELYRGYLNRYRKGWGKSWEYEMQRHYVAEIEFIRSKVKEKPDTIKGTEKLPFFVGVFLYLLY